METLIRLDDEELTVLSSDPRGEPNNNHHRAEAVLVVMHRSNPNLWFCSASDKGGTPLTYGEGTTKEEAEQNAQKNVASHAVHMRARYGTEIDLSALGPWQFVTYPPLLLKCSGSA